MSRLMAGSVYALVMVALLMSGLMAAYAQEKESVWLVWVKLPSSVMWEPLAQASSYTDCVTRLLPKAMSYWDKTTAWEQPQFKCEESTGETHETHPTSPNAS